MSTLAQFTKRRAAFEAFLVERGAQVLQPTNEWEVLRFKTARGVSVIYRNAKDGLTFTGEAADAWNGLAKGNNWRGVEAVKRPPKVSAYVRALLKRDGDACFYCAQPMSEEDRTVEHLVARSHGGPNHLSNMVLAHRLCNANAGHLSAMEKIRLRESREAA
ncbi:HNH endonuclease [Paraburkholderia unamae]|uniref:HNH endonuclease n=1 Tax=Paraburkholderia unamae TaxID=219649 RepID=A0ABX5KRW7_9BURK|nr:HNH endonuclease signature motif containing protein [Paraburkholderia unamae]PVX84320.1 HNH endonuclease [Paraburkholderia unamae]